MKFISFVYSVCVIWSPFVGCVTNGGIAEQLRFDLLKNYDIFTEPTPQNDTVLKINVGITILGIHVDYMKSTFYIDGWIGMKWYDSRMKWDPSKYNDLKVMHFAYHEIWKPQIIALNRVDAHNIDNNVHVNSIIDHTGLVLLVPVTNYKIFCDLNYNDWPFDEQVCELVIKITGTYKTPLYFNNTYNVDWYGTFSNWKIVNVNSQHLTAKSCPLCDGPSSSMSYEFKIQKIEQVYYGFVLLPAFGMCFLLLSTFWLPLTVMKKFSLTIILIIASLIFLILLSRKVPIFNHQLPKIMQFYIWLLVLSTVYLVVSLCLYNMINSLDLQTTPLSQKIRTFFDHPVLHSLHIVPDSEFVRYQLENIPLTGMDTDGYSKHQWLHLAIVINRIIFLFYTIFILILMLCYFI